MPPTDAMQIRIATSALGPTPRASSTASAIAQFGRIRDRATAASVGVALHHFTEPLGELPTLQLHRATAVLSKQARPLIDRPDGLHALETLVTDPTRVALHDGRTAAEICGDRWVVVAEVAAERITSARQGAEVYGQVAVLNLAVIRCVNSRQPWWGTAAWDRSVDAWSLSRRASRRLRRRLIEAPEGVPDEVLHDVLGF